jgi:hypothetical protein
MTLPKTIIEMFERESKDLQFGKVSICLVMRGGHLHYELDKHFTIIVDDKKENNKINGGDNDQTV